MVGALIFLPSTLFAISTDLAVFSLSRELSYISRDEFNSFQWLNNSTKNGSIIFASEKTGKLIPAYALRFVYVGHPVETPFYNQKKIQPAWYFSDQQSLEEQYNFLIDNRIDFVFYGPQEKLLNNNWSGQKNYLKSVYSNQTISIYQVL